MIIPVFNVENYLETCLNSIIINKQSEFEVIMVDDFSTDGSLAKIHTYRDIDLRIRVLENRETRLAGYCRNIGINIAIGDYVWFIDADDWLENLAIDKILENISRYPETDIFSFGISEHFDTEQGCYMWQKKWLFNNDNDHFKAFLQLKEGYSPMPFSYVFRREFLLNNNILFPEGVYYEDLFFTASSFYHAKKVRIIPSNLYVYNRSRLNSITNSQSTKKIVDFLYNYELERKFLFDVNADKNYLRMLNFRFVVSGLPRCFRMYFVLKANSISDARLWKILNSYRSKKLLSIFSLLECKKNVDFLFYDHHCRRAELTQNLRFLFYVKYAFKFILIRIYLLRILKD